MERQKELLQRQQLAGSTPGSKLNNKRPALVSPVKLMTAALRCFSLKSNLKVIGKLSQPAASGRERPLADIKVIHGLRTFAMIWIIFGHTIGLVNPEMMSEF